MFILKKLSISALVLTVAATCSLTFVAAPAQAASPQWISCSQKVAPGANLRSCDLRTENMSGADLTNADFTGANLQSAVLDGADLTGAILTGVTSGNIIGTPLNLPTGWNLIGGYLLGPGASLVQANLKSLPMSFVDLTGADLSYANLNSADLANANLTGANLTGVTSGNINGLPTLPDGWKISDVGGYLIGPTARLVGADFRNADLSGLNLSDQDLTGANFGSAKLAGTILTGAILTGVVSGGITGKPILSPGVVVAGGYLAGPNVNLKDANLSGQDLTGANLAGANLDFTNLKQANLTNVASGRTVGLPQLSIGWQSINGYLVGPAANLNGADFTGMSFKDVDLTSVDLSGATLDNITSGGVIGQPTLPTGWVLANGYLAGPKANLSNASLIGADLSKADLSNAVLTGADLTSANLSKANLTGVVTGSVQGNPTLGSKWHIVNGYLIGPGANLTSSDLSSNNFDGLDFSGADFSNAKLSKTTFVSADLSNTKFGGADLTDADLSKANLLGVASGQVAGVPVLSAPYQLGNGYIIGPGASLDGADLSQLALGYSDLTGANFYGANFFNTVLSFSTLDKCELRGADLTGASINGASLVGATSGDIKGTPKMSNDQTIINGYIVAQGVSLASADMSGQDLSALRLDGVSFVGANLTGTDLRSSNLSGADFSDATLDQAMLSQSILAGVISSGIIGTPKSLPTGWSLLDGVLLKQFSKTSVPTFTGSNKVGSTLTATVAPWSDPTTFDIFWLRDGLVISDVASPSYTLTNDDLGHVISVSVTGSAPDFATTTVQSTKSITVIPSSPAKMSAAVVPKISGKVKALSAVSASVAAWVTGAKISYQWLLDGKKIKGATGKTFKLAKTAKGHKVSVSVTQTATGYLATTKVSAAVKVG